MGAVPARFWGAGVNSGVGAGADTGVILDVGIIGVRKTVLDDVEDVF